nr:CotO family spore coat protein [uncultured Bacillus sp.]
MEKKNVPQPLFYIQQPALNFPEPEMQKIFIKKRTKTKNCSNEPVKMIEETENVQERANFIFNDGVSEVPILLEEEAAYHAEELSGKAEKPLEYIQSSAVVESEKEAEKGEITEQAAIHQELQQMISQFEMERQIEHELGLVSSKKNQTITLKRVKNFKEMDVGEKIEYLNHFPTQLPPVPCIFTTGSRSIRGFLCSKTEQVIEIKTFDEKSLQVPVIELKDIHMIGMK